MEVGAHVAGRFGILTLGLRYFLFQIPGLLACSVAAYALYHWQIVGWLAATAMVVVWALKDVALYPATRAAYLGTGTAPADALLGTEARVVRRLDPLGYVRVNGELWRARSEQEQGPVEENRRVVVTGCRALELSVRALPVPETNCG